MKIENIKREIEVARKIKCGKYIFHKYFFGEEGTYSRPGILRG